MGISTTGSVKAPPRSFKPKHDHEDDEHYAEKPGKNFDHNVGEADIFVGFFVLRHSPPYFLRLAFIWE
jgi:hypothetical protein